MLYTTETGRVNSGLTHQCTLCAVIWSTLYSLSTCTLQRDLQHCVNAMVTVIPDQTSITNQFMNHTLLAVVHSDSEWLFKVCDVMELTIIWKD